MKLTKASNILKTAAGTAFWAIIAFPMGALAAKKEFCTKETLGFLGFPTWYKYLDVGFGTDECNINFNLLTDLPKVLLAVFEIVLRVGGLLAVFFVLFGGVQYILSQGEPDKTKGARTTIVNAIIGLVITMSAVAIVNVIGKNL